MSESAPAKLEPALSAHEQQVESIARDIKRLSSAVKAWRKACAAGAPTGRAKSANQAADLAQKIENQIEEAVNAWDFDVRAYLVDDWLQELAEAAASVGLRAFRDDEMCVIPPLALSARPGQESLYLGKERLKMLRPSAVVAEVQARLAKGRDSANEEFLESVYRSWLRRQDKSSPLIKFREVYDLFCLAPGWRKENARPIFAQQIYSLHSGGLSATRDGKGFNLEEPSSRVSGGDVFEVRARDGRPIRYYGISFAG
jgi:hypothetical protein